MRTNLFFLIWVFYARCYPLVLPTIRAIAILARAGNESRYIHRRLK
jgi:hypothetical protein